MDRHGIPWQSFLTSSVACLAILRSCRRWRPNPGFQNRTHPTSQRSDQRILSTALGTMFYALAFTHFFPSMVRRRCFFCPCTSCFWMVIWPLGCSNVAAIEAKWAMEMFRSTINGYFITRGYATWFARDLDSSCGDTCKPTRTMGWDKGIFIMAQMCMLLYGVNHMIDACFTIFLEDTPQNQKL